MHKPAALGRTGCMLVDVTENHPVREEASGFVEWVSRCSVQRWRMGRVGGFADERGCPLIEKACVLVHAGSIINLAVLGRANTALQIAHQCTVFGLIPKRGCGVRFS